MLFKFLAYYLLFTAAFAYGQGQLMARLKQVSPGTAEAKQHHFALHRLFVLVWLLPAVWEFTWQAGVIALAVRFICFDLFLNLAEGNHPFAVGNTADTDKLLRKLATVSGVPVSLLSAVLRGAVLLLLIWGILIQLI